MVRGWLREASSAPIGGYSGHAASRVRWREIYLETKRHARAPFGYVGGRVQCCIGVCSGQPTACAVVK